MKVTKIDDYWQAVHDGPLRQIVVEAPTMVAACNSLQAIVRVQLKEKVRLSGLQELREARIR